MPVSDVYSRFARDEARGSSATYEQWATGIAADQSVIERISELPDDKQQPNLLFAAARFLGAEPSAYPLFREWLQHHWSEVRQQVLRRVTQTNEAGRCSALLPLLAGLPQPLALIEVGAAAGLCLYPDRYSYTYDDRTTLNPVDGPSRVLIQCSTNGHVPLPASPPTVVWRAGVDLNPLDVTSEDDRAWLRALVWPEQTQRCDRLEGAMDIAAQDPPDLVAGDLITSLGDLAARAPRDATLVVLHSAVITYLDATGRKTFADIVQNLPGHWVSNEGPGVFSFLPRQVPPRPDIVTARFLLELDAQPCAWSGPHGQSLDWIAQT